MIPVFFRRSIAKRAGLMLAVSAVVASLGGCSGFGGVGEAGAVLTGRERMAPLTQAPPVGRVTVQFLPFTGLPVMTADSIYRKIRQVAATHGIDLVHRLEDPATYRVKAHFVALGNESSTVLIASWNVYDASGADVFHFVAQDMAQSAQGDAWAGVGGGAQDRLAMAGVRGISAWLRSMKR